MVILAVILVLALVVILALMARGMMVWRAKRRHDSHQRLWLSFSPIGVIAIRGIHLSYPQEMPGNRATI
jgi:cytochrome bd-type quinol oxidase subunit 2